MHPVVVAWSEVDDSELSTRVAPGIARIADELAHVVRLSLDEDPSGAVDAPDARELTVARTHEGVRADPAHARLERSREERIEARKRICRDRCFLEIDAVGVAVGARDQPRHERMKRLVAQTPHGSADPNPRERMEDLRGSERGNAHGRPGSY